jgi:lipopolysaccharide/colanic/teichoic acid biosynthesis glycosyltransferase
MSVLLVLPILLPIFIAIAIVVRLTSVGPVIFRQERIGRRGRPFTILKFRTMEHAKAGSHKSVTTAANQRFTLIGPFLRRWKLDELPQLFNVLRGDMSLVGPRPKMLQHQVGPLPCRPGITGAATFAFAREEEFLASVPDYQLETYYHRIVLPAKQQLDLEYMGQATLRSDLELLVNTVLRRWDHSAIGELLKGFQEEAAARESKSPIQASHHGLTFDRQESLVSVD